MTTKSAQTRPITLWAADGQLLAGSLSDCATPQGAVLLCSATGVRQHFYAPFANWLAEHNYVVLTFDYRGIGKSLAGAHVRSVKTTKQDWGELDMPAALDWLAAAYPGVPLHLIGHSAGGQLIGLMPNFHKLTSVVQFAASSGYIANLRRPTRWIARFLLAGYIPLTAHCLGYVPAKLIGWGEDLPAMVATQWARWCLSPGYISNDFGREIKRHYYNDFDIPIRAIYACDDPIATQANIDDLLRLFPKALIRKIRLDPTQFGLQSIGHIDAFRPRLAVLWPQILAALP